MIETKNMQGWIFGGERQARWMQTIYGHKTQFQNPLWQNYKHVKAVQALLQVKQSQIFNTVVFVGDAEPQTEMPDNVLWDEYDLSDYILSKTTPVFSKEEIRNFIERIDSRTIESNRQSRREHVQSVIEQVESKEFDLGSCPKCGSELVERFNKSTGQKFLGCSRFPSCRGTRAVS